MKVILVEVIIIAAILAIIDLILLGVGGFLAYKHLMPLIIRKLSEKPVLKISDSQWEEKILTALRQVAKDYPESKKFMLILKQILITKE